MLLAEKSGEVRFSTLLIDSFLHRYCFGMQVSKQQCSVALMPVAVYRFCSPRDSVQLANRLRDVAQLV